MRELGVRRDNHGREFAGNCCRTAYDGDYGHAVDFNNTVTVIDEDTRSFAESVTGTNIGTYAFGWEISSTLTGTLLEGTSLCKPVAGTILRTYRRNLRGNDLTGSTDVTVTTVVKEVDDPYWRVASVNGDGETSEYFARELRIADSSYPEDVNFICDFVDL